MEDKERVEEASSVLSPRQFTRKTDLFSSYNSNCGPMWMRELST